MPHGSAQWQGHAVGRIKAQVSSSSATLPTQGWLIESQRDQAAGFVSYTKWGSAGFRYKKQAYFQVREKWEPDVVYLGRLETRDGSSELCVANPEHGGFQEGNTIVITKSYDYCVRLTRQ
jgi:hypothetical protein